MQTNRIWATVVSVDSTSRKITVKFDNGQNSSKAYRYPKTGYIPVSGDRALFYDEVCLGIY